jgi:murein DD-endopeptidase MepM/ murein hydrolase activator NlpD
VNEGTPIYTTIAGQVVWAAENGPWGHLVVVENDGYQVWLAHLSSIEVSEGDILEYGGLIGLSGNTGNSTGGHLHYGIKHRTEAGSFVWLDPRAYFTEDEIIPIGCSD